MRAEKDKLTPIISKSGTENQFVCRWGKSCLDHLPGIRCHSVTKCSAARTMNVNFWEPVWKHVSLVQRGEGVAGARASVKVQQRSIASDIRGWPLCSNFLKLFPLCAKIVVLAVVIKQIVCNIKLHSSKSIKPSNTWTATTILKLDVMNVFVVFISISKSHLTTS